VLQAFIGMARARDTGETRMTLNGMGECHRRKNHTMMKNQNTMTTKTMYHSHRQPCRVAMLFIRRNVPDRIPDVSANASF